jgi:hypothetical protein
MASTPIVKTDDSMATRKIYGFHNGDDTGIVVDADSVNGSSQKPYEPSYNLLFLTEFQCP